MTLSAEQRQERLNRPCKRCGKPLNSLVKSQTVCCGAGCLGWSSPVQVNCKVCGVEFESTEGRLKKFGDLCCSLACQNMHALVVNRGVPKPDWEKRSAKARKKWKRQRSKGRGSWVRAVLSRLAKVKPELSRRCWETAVSSRLATSLGRESKKKIGLASSKSVAEAIARIERKRQWYEASGLYRKVTNKLSNNRKRRARKDVRKKEQGWQDCRENQGVWFQMCIDWMED